MSSPKCWNYVGFKKGNLRTPLACCQPFGMLYFAVGLGLQSGELLSNINRIYVVGLDLEYTFQVLSS